MQKYIFSFKIKIKDAYIHLPILLNNHKLNVIGFASNTIQMKQLKIN